jgi:hypothetical protein
MRPVPARRNTCVASDGIAKPADTTCLAWEDNLEYWRVLHGVENGTDERTPVSCAIVIR